MKRDPNGEPQVTVILNAEDVNHLIEALLDYELTDYCTITAPATLCQGLTKLRQQADLPHLPESAKDNPRTS